MWLEVTEYLSFAQVLEITISVVIEDLMYQQNCGIFV